MGVGYLTGQGGGGSLKSIQFGIFEWGSSLTQDTITISNVDINSSVVHIEYLPIGNASTYATAASIINQNTIQFNRSTSGTLVLGHKYFWVVCEYKNVKSKQTGITVNGVNSPSTKIVTVSDFNIEKSLIAHSNISTVAAQSDGLFKTVINIKTSNSIELMSSSGIGLTEYWQLIEFK